MLEIVEINSFWMWIVAIPIYQFILNVDCRYPNFWATVYVSTSSETDVASGWTSYNGDLIT